MSRVKQKALFDPPSKNLWRVGRIARDPLLHIWSLPSRQALTYWWILRWGKGSLYDLFMGP